MEDELTQKIFEMEIIDTHEHLPSFESKRETKTDFLTEYLSQYLISDLISAGLRPEAVKSIKDSDKSIFQKWELVEPYWHLCKYTGYTQALNLAVQDLYGINNISSDTLGSIEEAFQASLQENHYNYVLKKRSKIKISLLNDIQNSIECDRSFFRPVFQIDKLILPKEMNDLSLLEQKSNINIVSFRRYLEAVEIVINSSIKAGAVALKLAIAYQRSLSFNRSTYFEAEKEFEKVFTVNHIRNHEQPYFILGEFFQNFILHFIMEICNHDSVPVQIHCGIQEGNGNVLDNSNPLLLSNLFLEYPRVQFDIFHIGYPFEHILGVLAKNFPNVFIDMCWIHIISPNAAIYALQEWIESVPINKILAFGGDYLFIDGVYGHQKIARLNIAKVLLSKIRSDLMSQEEACEIARMVLYENPKKLFKLNHIDN